MVERDEAVSGLSVFNSSHQGQGDHKDDSCKQRATHSRERL
jgi:hypothetical protein